MVRRKYTEQTSGELKSISQSPQSSKQAPKLTQIGKLGEDAATAYLEEQNYKIILRNWRCPEGELDIVAMDKSTLTIIEVKTRAKEIAHAFSPFEAVDARKESRLKRLANRLIFIERMKIKAHHPQRIRFDVMGVLYEDAGGALNFECNHLIDAFNY
jgi:putative endonuclease